MQLIFTPYLKVLFTFAKLKPNYLAKVTFKIRFNLKDPNQSDECI